jgi:hypothetical protein
LPSCAIVPEDVSESALREVIPTQAGEKATFAGRSAPPRKNETALLFEKRKQKLSFHSRPPRAHAPTRKIIATVIHGGISLVQALLTIVYRGFMLITMNARGR